MFWEVLFWTYSSIVLSFPENSFIAHNFFISRGLFAVRPGSVDCAFVPVYAGVGRTGTFIALDIALEQLEAEKVVDLTGVVNKMRAQRAKMVQTVNQFVFLHDTILEHALCGKTLVPTGPELRAFMNQLDEGGDQTGKNGYEKHFQLLQRITPKMRDTNCTVAKCHPDKNRDGVALPSDQRRVVLLGHDNNYINASFVDGYQQKKGYIVAQSPLHETVADFWRAVLQHKCATIVMLCNLVENGKEVCCQYWPSEDDSAVFDHYSVKSMSFQQSEECTKRVLGLKDTNTGHCHTVTQFHVTSWLPDGQCPNHLAITSLIDRIQEVQRHTGNNPILVHCSDSVTRSGMFCATSVAVEQARVERMVDIFQVVKTLKIQRPGSIPLLDHYTTIYQLVTTYLSVFETYAV